MLAAACADVEPEEADVEELASREQALVTCSSTPSKDEDFYKLPTTLPAKNGTLIRCKQLPTAPANTKAYRVIYKTTTILRTGSTKTEVALPASGQIVVPDALPLRPDKSVITPGADGKLERPVIASTHGASGVIPACGPTKLKIQDGYPRYLDGVFNGAVIAYPDYAGLGIDSGLRVVEKDYAITWPNFTRSYPFSHVSHPFNSIEGEGRATVDIVRAAREVANLAENTRWISFGQSQGGHAALAAAEVFARNYGSETRLLGVVAGAPATELDNSGWWADEFDDALIGMLAATLPLEFRDLRATNWFTPSGIAAFGDVGNKICFTEDNLAESTLKYWIAQKTLKNGMPWADPAAKAALAINSPGRAAITVPVFVGVVRGDPVIDHRRVATFVQTARGVSKNKISFCEYRGVDPKLSPLLRSDNHNAFEAMFNHVEPYWGCTHDGSKYAFKDPRSFVGAIYADSFPPKR